MDMPHETDIEDQFNEATVLVAAGIDPFPGSGYAGGVVAALAWVMGESTDPPLELRDNPTDPPPVPEAELQADRETRQRKPKPPRFMADPPGLQPGEPGFASSLARGFARGLHSDGSDG